MNLEAIKELDEEAPLPKKKFSGISFSKKPLASDSNNDLQNYHEIHQLGVPIDGKEI